MSAVRPFNCVGRMALVCVTLMAASTAAGSIKVGPGRIRPGPALRSAKWIADAVATMVWELKDNLVALLLLLRRARQ